MPSSSPSPRASLTLVFMAFGAFVGCWAGSIPTVARAALAGNLELGIGLSVSTLAGVSIMGLGGKMARVLTGRTLIASALVLSAFSTALLLLSGSPWVLLLNMILFGACLGLLDISMNAEAGAIERELKRPVFTSFHGALSAAMPLFAILSSAMSVRYGLAYTVIACLAISAPAIAAALIGLPSRPPAPARGGAAFRFRP
ncbi:MAG: MFS transporter [Rhizobiales bacterium]|nr:MFS transporter [Hyphomicrobiales bacterium]